MIRTFGAMLKVPGVAVTRADVVVVAVEAATAEVEDGEMVVVAVMVMVVPSEQVSTMSIGVAVERVETPRRAVRRLSANFMMRDFEGEGGG